MEPITWTLRHKYSEGPWVARITGLDPQYRLARTFLQGVDTSPPSGKIGAHAFEVKGPGLYQWGGAGGGGICIVWVKDGILAEADISMERAADIARYMDMGEDFEAARKATRRKTASAQQ